MDTQLRLLLINLFVLSEREFSEHLTREQIGAWDSLRHMDLVGTLESEYNIQLTMDEILAMNSIADIASTLRAKGVDV